MDKSKEEKDFGVIVTRSIKAWRLARGMSQSELAHKTGMKTSAISRIERGHGNLRLNTALAISDALGVSLREMLGPVESEYEMFKESFKALSPEQKQVIMAAMESMAKK